MRCVHFGSCGGCTVDPSTRQPAPYALQCAEKEARVRSLLNGFSVDEWRPIIPSPQPWNYRNKMEFAFGQPFTEEHVPFCLGLREAGRYDRIVDLQECHLISPEAFSILREVRAWALEQRLAGYHRRRHEGDLRYLVIREGINTGQRMAVLVARQSPSGIDALANRLRPFVSTFWLGVTAEKSDIARAQDMRLLIGTGAIEETLGGVRYRISPYSFFQTNTRGTETLYGLLRDWATDGSGALLDLYCGSGGITLALADCFDRVIGVDTNADAIEDGRANAELNGFSTVEFVCDDALQFMDKLPASKFAVQLSALVVDPPRPGLHPKALSAVVDLNPPRLAYVSCNPESLTRDLAGLVPHYRITSVQPVDLFPNTPHVETVCLMEHR